MQLQKNAGAVGRFAKLMKFSAWLQALPNKLTPPPFRLMQIGSAFWQSRVLYVAARLDLATVLGDEALDAKVIAARIATAVDATARLLRMLAAMGVFEETAPQVYRNNKLSNFLRTDKPKNVRAMILMHNSETMSRPWFEQLERGVREGVPPFRLCHGDELFDYLDHHADFDKLFSEAMDSVEALTGDSFVTDFDWGRFGRIIDVGGSRGTKSSAILRRHPHMTALVVDRGQVIAEAQRYWATHRATGSERLSFQTGDLLSSIPTAQDERDIYLLCAVLHGFDDETCIKALANLARASGSSGARIAVMEMVLPEAGADLASASFDMQMFMGTRGRERTLAQWTSLLERSGMALEEVVGLQSFGSILVMRPKNLDRAAGIGN
ncbi:MAG: methyltransferase [Betaproteobacteria bacterium HGW-Betaproteobacteria-18]|nr:MAG: methyltransferase [Betaproteobacteria bacterium HGW-Betaproteobacteria-18]